MAKHDFSTSMIVEMARERLKVDERDKAPRIADEVLHYYRHDLRNLPAAFVVWIREGLQSWAAKRFKKQGTGNGHGLTSQMILDLWTEPDERKHIVSLGDFAAYLPSRAEYVDLTPDLSDDELDEIGDYKISFGEATVAQGMAIKALAAARRAKRRPH